MAAEPDPAALVVHVVPMRRRHLRSVLHIEAEVYPRPWSMSLFMSELGMRATRAYFVARVGRNVVGYCGLMLTGDDGHITTIAVDPVWHRQQIGTRLLLALVHEVRPDQCTLVPVKPGEVTSQAGWPGDTPLDLVTGWIEESYRIVAPKRIAKLLDDG